LLDSLHLEINELFLKWFNSYLQYRIFTPPTL